MASYNMAPEIESWYRLDENGNATVTVRSKTPLKPRAVYVGEATMQFMWVHTGKSTHWQFTPTILNPTPAQYTEAMDGQGQTITIELGKVVPASGLINSNVAGEIRASAIQFDLPYAIDLWVFILCSPSEQLKVTAQKPLLSITHTLAQVMAQIESGNSNFGQEDALRTYVTMHGEGFTNVTLNLKRHTMHSATEESLGEIKYGGLSATWQPTVKDFDVILTTSSSMTEPAFVGFLESLGAEVKKGFFASLKGDFLLCDGPAIEYTLILKGEKRYIGKEEDKTSIKLEY